MSAPDGGVGGPLTDGDLVVPDLMLEELRDNGGPSWTHMPLDGSPVIDVGSHASNRSCIDQRGFPRDVDVGEITVGCRCDAGAVEAGSAPMPQPRQRDSSAGADS
jgi:hypothetical protein